LRVAGIERFGSDVETIDVVEPRDVREGEVLIEVMAAGVVAEIGPRVAGWAAAPWCWSCEPSLEQRIEAVARSGCARIPPAGFEPALPA
jgi:hypothetical protein